MPDLLGFASSQYSALSCWVIVAVFVGSMVTRDRPKTASVRRFIASINSLTRPSLLAMPVKKGLHRPVVGYCFAGVLHTRLAPTTPCIAGHSGQGVTVHPGAHGWPSTS